MSFSSKWGTVNVPHTPTSAPTNTNIVVCLALQAFFVFVMLLIIKPPFVMTGGNALQISHTCFVRTLFVTCCSTIVAGIVLHSEICLKKIPVSIFSKLL